MIEEELPDGLENDLDDIEPVGDESQLYEHFRVVVDKGQAMVRVDKYLFERIVNASRNRIQKAAEDGFVMANGKPVKSSYKVKPLDVITVMMDRPRYENEIIPENIPLTIVYEDPYLMVVNKPAGLVVHPGHGNYHGTLVNALLYRMEGLSGIGGIHHGDVSRRRIVMGVLLVLGGIHAGIVGCKHHIPAADAGIGGGE